MSVPNIDYVIKKCSSFYKAAHLWEVSLNNFSTFQGMDLYFKRHDAQAVTCEDFFAAMRDANDVDFANFLLWSLSAFCFF
jgi:aminopeptidase N